MFKDKLKIVPLTNVNKYFYDGKNKVRKNVNNSSEKQTKKKPLRLKYEIQMHNFKRFGSILHLLNYVINLIGSLAAQFYFIAKKRGGGFCL